MDAKNFGAFVAQVRKERGLTQAGLADLLHVTDKAVSRWERGVGFPDIGLLQPLAEALGVTLAELMGARRAQQLTAGEASDAVADTVSLAQTQQKKLLLRLGAAALALLALIGLWMLVSGATTRADVYVADYAILPSSLGDALTVRVGLAGSMGFLRACKNISEDPTRARLVFYSAWGGLNSRLGAKNVFLVELPPECTAVSINDREPFLIKEAGQWVRAK